MDWIAPNCLNITSWASFIREVVVMGIRGCGSSGLDWPVVTGGLRHNNKLKQGLTGTHFQTRVCRHTYKVEMEMLASILMVFVFMFAVSAFVILALVAWSPKYYEQDARISRPDLMFYAHCRGAIHFALYTVVSWFIHNMYFTVCTGGVMVFTHVHCSMQYVSKLPGSPDHSNGLCQYWWLLSAGQETKIYIGNQTC